MRLLRSAVRGGGLLFQPRLPACLVENSDTCPADKDGKRLLPDQSLWLVSLLTEVGWPGGGGGVAAERGGVAWGGRGGHCLAEVCA